MTTTTPTPTDGSDRINWLASLPFLLVHASVLLVAFTGIGWKWVLVALVSYGVRMFGVTAGYHRYFAHRAFKTSRAFQLFLAVLAQLSVQKGVLWWGAHHRHHHRHSDGPEDIHSPARRGFWWSHVGWILSDRYNATNTSAIKDFARYPELRWLDRWHLVPPAVGLLALWGLGGLEWLVWGGLVPTVALWHGTFFINSLTHIIGSRRYLTSDMSRNSFLLAIVCWGEGWHNNHHFHQNTANQGWFWWEVDFTYYGLKVLGWLGLVWGLRMPSIQTKLAFEAYTEAERARLKKQSRYGMFLPDAEGRPAPAMEASPG